MWLWHASASSHLNLLDICLFLSGWMGACSRAGHTLEVQEPEGGWFKEECCQLKPSLKAGGNGSCTAAHYHTRALFIRDGRADSQKAHTWCGHTHRHTNTLWALPQLPWQSHNSCVWTENQVLRLKAQLGLSSVTWIQQTWEKKNMTSFHQCFCILLLFHVNPLLTPSLSWIKNCKVWRNYGSERKCQ